MREDMAKVVTERPRRGHSNRSKKWGRRLNKTEYELEDHGASRAPIARHRQYNSDWKEFSDLLGPLRRYLRNQIGRPWNKVWSEITQSLDSRSLTGQHIFDHIRWEIEREAWIGRDGRPWRTRWGSIEPVTGLFVHPATNILAYVPEPRRGGRNRQFLKAHADLQRFGVVAPGTKDVRRYRVDGWRVWERRDCGWFIHSYRLVPEQLVRVITRSDGREIPIYSAAHLERVATKQASKNEIGQAASLLERDPLADRNE